MLEASEDDIDFKSGMFCVKGTDRSVSLQRRRQKIVPGEGLPAEFGIGLDGTGTHPGPFTFPNGCMICEVEVDTDTGPVQVVRLTAVDDVGTVINPMTLEGQLHGSTAQGLGETLLEQMIYERGSGQLVTGSFQDYAMPRADNMPPIVSGIRPVADQAESAGREGRQRAGKCRRAGRDRQCDCRRAFAVQVTDVPMPATPERIWNLSDHPEEVYCSRNVDPGHNGHPCNTADLSSLSAKRISLLCRFQGIRPALTRSDLPRQTHIF